MKLLIAILALCVELSSAWSCSTTTTKLATMSASTITGDKACTGYCYASTFTALNSGWNGSNAVWSAGAVYAEVCMSAQQMAPATAASCKAVSETIYKDDAIRGMGGPFVLQDNATAYGSGSVILGSGANFHIAGYSAAVQTCSADGSAWVAGTCYTDVDEATVAAGTNSPFLTATTCGNATTSANSCAGSDACVFVLMGVPAKGSAASTWAAPTTPWTPATTWATSASAVGSTACAAGKQSQLLDVVLSSDGTTHNFTRSCVASPLYPCNHIQAYYDMGTALRGSLTLTDTGGTAKAVDSATLTCLGGPPNAGYATGKVAGPSVQCKSGSSTVGSNGKIVAKATYDGYDSTDEVACTGMCITDDFELQISAGATTAANVMYNNGGSATHAADTNYVWVRCLAITTFTCSDYVAYTAAQEAAFGTLGTITDGATTTTGIIKSTTSTCTGGYVDVTPAPAPASDAAIAAATVAAALAGAGALIL